MQLADSSPGVRPAGAFLASLADAELPDAICRNLGEAGSPMTDETRPLESAGTGFAFARRRKLLKHADFQRVYKNGKRLFGGHLTFFYLPRAEQLAEDGPRLGLTVSRALGGAVDRNRIRRRVREAVRLHLGELSIPMDVVINPKKSASTVAFAQLEAEVTHAFQVIRRAAANHRMKSAGRAQAEGTGKEKGRP